jgi:adenine phosphoribosyltransferase
MPELLAKSLIRSIPDFPKPGILFRDITPVLENPAAFKQIIDQFALFASERNIDAVVGVESRGFVFGAPLALALGKPFVLIRKVGKLPFHTVKEEYELEYGSATIEVHEDALTAGSRAVIVDDLLATGGTAKAAGALLKKIGAEVAGYSFLIELTALGGREKLNEFDIQALLPY